MVVATLVLLFAGAPAKAGHEMSFYPAFYPQEITIERLDRTTGAALLAKSTLHAYVGSDPFAGTDLPKDVTAVESLGSYVVLTFNPAAARSADAKARCAAAARAPRAGYIFHPYPITPYDPDYIDYFDLAQAAKKRAERLPSIAPSDATLEEISLERLLDANRLELAGVGASPWRARGWYHAYLLLRPTVGDGARRRLADADYVRLTRDAAHGVRRVEIERHLIATLTAGCERLVLGYRPRREYVNTEYSQGVENVARDPYAGLDAPIFVRSVKLKDFPWNGWLHLGIETAPASPWNPIAGFTDPFGRLMWSALGDPPFMSQPYGSGWLNCRVSPSGVRDHVDVPADALAADPKTGRLLRVGPGRRAGLKIEYRVLASAFHDGSTMGVADALAPFAFAYRWASRESAIAGATALLRARLVAIRPVKVERVVRKQSDVTFVYDFPIIDVYLADGAGELGDTTTLAPPWSAVPWQVIALEEEAVNRGLATFASLDLVRDSKLGAALAALVDEFAARAFVPPELATLVKPEEARRRWTALKSFYREHHHFLVTDGAYALKEWSDEKVVLEVFRDMTYPLGVGTYDAYAIPTRAYVANVEDRGDRIDVHADVERVNKFARSYEIVREHLGVASSSAEVQAQPTPSCRFVVVAADGHVTRVGVAPSPSRGTFRIDLSRLPVGRYIVLIDLTLEGTVNPDVTTIDYVAEKSRAS